MSPIQAEHDRRVLEWSDIQGHLEFMRDQVLERKATTVVELGVRSGYSTFAFLSALEHTDGHLYSVDIDGPSLPPYVWEHPQFHYVAGDDLTVASEVPEHIDILFIDSSHWYYHTLAELALYGPRADLILLHDTLLERPYLQPSGEPPFPVWSAIVDWCAETGRSYRNRDGSFGLGIIER